MDNFNGLMAQISLIRLRKRKTEFSLYRILEKAMSFPLECETTAHHVLDMLDAYASHLEKLEMKNEAEQVRLLIEDATSYKTEIEHIREINGRCVEQLVELLNNV
jgi:hypothetical protein